MQWWYYPADPGRYCWLRGLSRLLAGWNIRKINQAWFAFNGTYADSPSSTSNIDKELLEFFNNHSSIKEAVDKLKYINSIKDYNILIEDSADMNK